MNYLSKYKHAYQKLLSYLFKSYGVGENDWIIAPETEQRKELIRFFGELPEKYDGMSDKEIDVILEKKLYLYENTFIEYPVKIDMYGYMMSLTTEEMKKRYPEMFTPDQYRQSIRTAILLTKTREEEPHPVNTFETPHFDEDRDAPLSDPNDPVPF